jgi:iron-regulated transporter 1
MENGGEQDLKHARRILFVSCFARQFLQWALQFNLVVWFYQTESGLFLISLFKATASFSVLTMVPRLSRRIDEAAAGTTLNRKQFATYVIIAENACVLVVAIALGFIVLNINKGYGSRNLMYSLVGISLLFGASYQVLYQVLLITMERDWIVVMASGNDDWLQKTNVILKQVFLVAKIISPVVTGKVLEISSGISWIVGCAILSFLIELMCIHQVFKLVPKLQQQHQKNPEKINKRNETSITKCSCLKNFQLYLSQSMVWAGLAYALFHSNVSFCQ